jgi:hypothetical protein
MDGYKLTVYMYDTIWAFQGGLCYACGQPEPVEGRRLSVDHDHTTALVRGLLCSRCNPLLGKIENAFKRYGLGKYTSIEAVLLRLSYYVEIPPATLAFGMKEHYGYPGRTGTKAHRKRLKREAKLLTPTVEPGRSK